MRIEDLGRVRFPESMEEALSKINPNGHDEVNDANFAWSGNCTHCVPAYELRKRGYDVSALPYTETRMACLMTRLMHGKTLLSTKLPAAAARQSNGQWHLTAMGPVWK